MRVTADPIPSTGRRLLVELLVRAIAVVLVAGLILILLPAMAEAAA
jgi:hypothetical protein